MNYLKQLVKSKTVKLKLSILGALSLIALVGIMPVSAASGVPTNDASNIVNGGLSSPTALVNAYNTKNPSDIQPIYNAFGLQASDLANFAAHAVTGTLNKDGTLTVNGQIVADNAQALGRMGPSAGYQQTTPMSIAGKTYYTTPLSYILGFYGLASTNAYVLMNGDQVQFTAMTACGNPVKVTQPKESCNMLKSTKVNDQTYNFTADVTATNGATLSKVVYDFGDKSATVTETSPSTVVTHTYSQAGGQFTAKVTAYFTYHGQTIVKNAVTCEKVIIVPTPKPTPTPSTALCSALDKPILIDSATRKYSFTAHAQVTGTATLVNASFNFGDSVTVSNLVPTAPNTVTTDHSFPDTTKTYTIIATLNFTVDSSPKAASCQTSLSLTQSTPTPTPTPTPTVLPSTGPEDMVGSGLGIGGIVAAGTYYFRTRRDLLSTIFAKR